MSISTLAVVTLLVAAPVALTAPAAYPDGTIDLGDGRFAVPLKTDRPSWYTQDLHEKVVDAGEAGLAFDVDRGVAVPLATNLLFIRPGAMMLFPSGCTMAFITGKAGDYSITSAGHCTIKGEPVVILAAPSLIASIGETKAMSDNDVGSDWSVTPIADEFQAFVDPNVAVIGGPQGEHEERISLSDPVAVKHYGHGLVVGTGGTPRAGVALETSNKAVFFTSASAPGDSGSPVLTAGSATAPFGAALGILTHLIVDTRHPGTVVAGTRITAVPGDVVDGDLNPLP